MLTADASKTAGRMNLILLIYANEQMEIMRANREDGKDRSFDVPYKPKPTDLLHASRTKKFKRIGGGS